MGLTPSFNDLQVLSPISWVKEEQDRQKRKWGEQNHGPYKYFAILSEELGEVAKVLEDVTYGKYESHKEYRRQLEYELVQVAAVSVSWIEAIRREKGAEQPPRCDCADCRVSHKIHTLKALIDDIGPSDISAPWETNLANAAAEAVKQLEASATDGVPGMEVGV